MPETTSATSTAAAGGGKIAALDALKLDAGAPSMIFQRVTDGETLPQIAKSLGCPKGLFVQWYTTEHADLWDAAQKVFAADMAIEALEISDGAPRQAVDPSGAPLFDDAGKPVLVEPSVGRDKLRAATRQWFSARYHREQFGERASLKVNVEDNRAPPDREAALLETGRRIAFLLYSAGAAAAEKATMPLLAAPENIPTKKPQEKNVSDPGII